METESKPCRKTTPKKQATRGWPPARRKAQAANARKTRPWDKTTGPRSATGKDRSSLNATKHGRDSAASLELRALLAEHARMMATLDIITPHK